jgi:diguanylate cyclase (GGDEF)-like protein
MIFAPHSSALETDRDLSSSVPDEDNDSTMRQPNMAVPHDAQGNECCLVQIYPADIAEGMLLLENAKIVAGRDLGSDLLLEDAGISRRHAEFIRQEGGYAIRDLGSTNGTTVNGTRVTEHLLRCGDTIKMGTRIFKFLSAGSVESKYHETVYSAMTRDALTGAMNKRYLLDALRREVARSVRHQQPMSVLMLDIDHFKAVNDNHGHLIGDELLREFGARMLTHCREDDLFARFGGEEFCIVLCSTARQEAIEIAERNRRVVCETPFTTAIGPLNITASFGLACFDREAQSPPEILIREADKKLYDAKRNGRNCVMV